MAKMITVEVKKCTGCKTCELICSFVNDKEFNSLRSRIRNIASWNEGIYASFTCMQCDHAPCVRVCPSGAMHKDDRIVKIESTRCIGCKLCVLVCPFGNIRFHEEKGSPLKCELCGGDPQCVEYCPTGALRYEELGERNSAKQYGLFEKLKQTYFRSDFFDEQA